MNRKRRFHHLMGVIVFVAILIGARSFVAADSLPENESCNSGLISDDTEFVEIDESVATEESVDAEETVESEQNIDQILDVADDRISNDKVTNDSEFDAGQADSTTEATESDVHDDPIAIADPVTEDENATIDPVPGVCRENDSTNLVESNTKNDSVQDSVEIIEPVTNNNHVSENVLKSVIQTEIAVAEVATDKTQDPVAQADEGVVSLPKTHNQRSDAHPLRITKIQQIPEQLYIGESATFLAYTINPQGDPNQYNFEYRILEMSGKEYVISDGPSPQVTYNFVLPGTYFLKLKFKDGAGQVATYNKQLDVQRKPLTVLKVTNTPNPISLNKNVTFSAYIKNPAGAAENYRFQYKILEMSGKEYVIADGRSSIANYNFKLPGTYFLKFSMTDGLGAKATYNKKLEIQAPPLVIYNVITDPEEIQINDPVKFSAYIKNPLGAKKDFRFEFVVLSTSGKEYLVSNSPSSLVNYQFSEPGRYYLKLKMTDGLGRVATYNREVKVSINPSYELPHIVRVIQSKRPLYTHDPVRFSTICKGVDYDYVFKYYLKNSAGQKWLIGNTTIPTISFKFTMPDTYTLETILQDRFNRENIYIGTLRVEKNPGVALKTIFLSPSNQPNNLYWNGSTSEREQMEIVAELVKEGLSEYKANVYLPDYELEDRLGWRKPGYQNEEAIKITGRPTHAKELNADFYLAIHSNASGYGGYCSGPLALYHPDSALSKAMAQALYDNMMAVTPFPDQNGGVKNGMLAFGGEGYGEVRSPYKLGIPSVLFEVNFHDNANTGQWILDNRPTIAKAIVKSIVETLDLQLKPEEEEEVAEYLITDEKWRLIVKTNEDETLPINEETIHSVAIMGVATATQAQARAWAESKGAADWFIRELPTFWRIATEVGIDPVVVYAQSAHETGFGKFTGVVHESYHNPCGMKTTVGGADHDITAHCQFDSWETGIRAQVDHLALYAGAPGYPKSVSAKGTYIVGNNYESPDPRHFPYLYGTAQMLWELGGKWAPSPQYGEILAEKVLMIRKQG